MLLSKVLEDGVQFRRQNTVDVTKPLLLYRISERAGAQPLTYRNRADVSRRRRQLPLSLPRVILCVFNNVRCSPKLMFSPVSVSDGALLFHVWLQHLCMIIRNFPDIISNITIAKQGFPRMGYAACFGGPMFNTLLGLGLTYGMSASLDPEYLASIRIGNMAPGCLAFLLFSLLASLIYLNITGAIARRSYGGLLYSIYIAFMVIQVLSELHIIHPLGTDYRAD